MCAHGVVSQLPACTVVLLWSVADLVLCGSLNLDTKTLQQQQQQMAVLARDLQMLRDKIVQLEARLDAANDNVVFQARLRGERPEVVLGPRDSVVYDHVITNTGESYNSSSGLFTAPVPATYAFYLCCRAPEGDTLNLTLVVDTEVKALCLSRGEATSGSAALQLAPGARVKVVNGDDVTKVIAGGAVTQFSGFLINAFAWL